MSIYVDADAFVRWEKGEFDLPGWLEDHAGSDEVKFPATAWQQLTFGVFAWEKQRATKRAHFLEQIAGVATVADFSKHHAVRAAKLAAELKLEAIGFADFQIAATTLEDSAELLTFNREHFARVPHLKLAAV